MSRDLLEALLRREELSDDQVDRLVSLLVDPARSEVERAALLIALRAKGESTREIAAFARALRARATPFPGPRAAGAVDLCGSGGALRPSFNVGTVGAFVVRAAGVPVAKHGNRSARGAEGGWAGSSDLLEALGLPFLSSREYAAACFAREGITFLHAPLYHPATRAVVPVRRALGVPTVFNWIGPLTNPASVRYQLVGCPTPAIAGELARVLPLLGVVRGATVSGSDGTDELSPTHFSHLTLFTKGGRSTRRIDPKPLLDADERRGPWGPLPAAQAAHEAERLLAGGGGARRGSVLLTSGAALWVRGAVPTLSKGVEQATRALDSGEAEAVLGRLRDLAGSRRWEEEG
jgi:anthranilate phosphoribosyltransferase